MVLEVHHVAIRNDALKPIVFVNDGEGTETVPRNNSAASLSVLSMPRAMTFFMMCPMGVSSIAMTRSAVPTTPNRLSSASTT